jgi:hypothetical protein
VPSCCLSYAFFLQPPESYVETRLHPLFVIFHSRLAESGAGRWFRLAKSYITKVSFALFSQSTLPFLEHPILSILVA